MNNVEYGSNFYLILITFLLFVMMTFIRFLPFIFKQKFEDSTTLKQVGVLLPCAIMLLLVLHSIEFVDWLKAPYGLPELLCIGIAVLLYMWKKNLLLPLICSNAIYLVMVNVWII